VVRGEIACGAGRENLEYHSRRLKGKPLVFEGQNSIGRGRVLCSGSEDRKGLKGKEKKNGFHRHEEKCVGTKQNRKEKDQLPESCPMRGQVRSTVIIQSEERRGERGGGGGGEKEKPAPFYGGGGRRKKSNPRAGINHEGETQGARSVTDSRTSAHKGERKKSYVASSK